MDAFTDHAVNDDERLVGCVQGSTLADTDRAGGTGGTGPLGDLQTGDLTEEEVFGRVGFHAVQFIRFHGDDGSGRIRFPDFTITDDNHLVEIFVVFGQLDPSRYLGSPERDSRITDAADFDSCVRTGYPEDKFAIQPGGHTVVSPLFDDGGSDNRTLRIDDSTSHLVSALGGHHNGRHTQ